MGGADMVNCTRWVGLDVHRRETRAAVVDSESGELREARIVGGSREVCEWLETLPRPFRGVYEAGPTGYALARRAAERGLEVAVCAPGHITRRPGDRIKTDARDAQRLARLYAAGELVLVAVPLLEDEQLRDLVRSREQVRGDLMRARHRIGAFLMRRERDYPGPGRAWTLAHIEWLGRLRLDDRASEFALADHLHAHEVLLARRGQLERELAALAETCRFAPQIARLRCLRGIDTLSAIGLVAEVGDLGRFAHPERLASYLGLVPSEDSSGERRRQGAITKSGSTHARRLLVEAAWHYRRPPRLSLTLERRQRGQAAWAIDCAWRCQRRLHRRWQRLGEERGKRATVVAIAVARELSHFCWQLAVDER
jgi:transposase